MIILEGPDGAGKTTLKDELMDEFPDLVEGERGTKDRDRLWTVTRSDTYKALRIALDPESPPTIWDRLFYSEFVYFPITSRECQFGLRDKVLIPKIIRDIGAPVIWCMPSFEVVKANAAKDHQMAGVDDNLDFIYESYVGMRGDITYFPQGLSLLDYDYTHPTARERKYEIFGRVEAWLRDGQVPA